MNRDIFDQETAETSTGDSVFTDQSDLAPAHSLHVIADQITPITPITPDPSLTSQSKYQWDQSAYSAVLPVRCKNTSGELHKEKFGSGGRGRCIRVSNEWLTPSEFELKCGRGSSKDWKRSIRYAGRPLQCLIEENVLHPHATSCTCAACCDDETVSGPVRLFVPYKRRKREGDEMRYNEDLSPSPQIDTTGVAILTPTTPTPTTTTSRDTIHVVTADGTIVGTASPDTPVITLNAPHLKPLSFNFNEEKQWWQLEEAVNNLISSGNQLKNLIAQIKEQSKISRENALSRLRLQMEKEKMSNENVDNFPEGNFKRCANCNREAFSECTGCHNVSYCSTFCQQKDWVNHHTQCGASNIVLLQEIEFPDKTK
uniref:Deformed epidermal autoregulatory factor 1 n=1 Tax=Strigamia maritima TaxID=126957 RepID=T1IQ13_STRMM